MAIRHVLDAVGNDLARRQTVEHAIVPHRNPVIDSDGVEFLGNASRLLDFAGHELSEILQVNVAGHELAKGVDDRDDRLAEIAILHAGCPP
jgi:hypothetical protein